MQFPLKPVYADPPNIVNARLRPKHSRLELSIPYDPAIFSPDSNQSSSNVQKLISSRLAHHSSLGAAVIRDGAFHITPIKEVLQIRPSFKEMEARGEKIELMSDDEDSPRTEKKPVIQQVQMRRKENEKAQANRNLTFTQIQAQEDAEPWHRVDVFPPGDIYFS